MVRLLLGLTLLLLFSSDNGVRQGRRGNAAYHAGRYAEAAEFYRQGLLLTQNPTVRFGLQHNLGAALLHLNEAGAARAAFDAALRMAPNNTERARAAYNAGNAAFAEGDLQAALHYYRTALLAAPDFEDARFNYEYILRHLPSSNPPPVSSNHGASNNPDGADTRNAAGQQSPDMPDNSQRKDTDRPSSESNTPRQSSPSVAPRISDTSTPLSPEMVARLLDALQRQEREALRRALRLPTSPRKVAKDW
ncbi:MAG: tetratricopeptide repeat protein [Rhodothermus sp.]|nr:tetratricopeptide repeat protein [Rhodothermus sp.]